VTLAVKRSLSVKQSRMSSSFSPRSMFQNATRSVGPGALATALVQFSSAVTALTVTLVDAGTMSFRSSLGVLLGANIGTTSTAWLVSLKLTSIGPFFIVFGTLLSALPTRFRILGKAAFYFGFIFFSLDVVSFTLKPLAQNPIFAEVLKEASTPVLGVLAGMLVTAVVQSSSITTGLCILLVQQNLLPATAAIPIVIGASVGSTSTALVASIKMQRTARRVAIANLCFNLLESWMRDRRRDRFGIGQDKRGSQRWESILGQGSARNQQE